MKTSRRPCAACIRLWHPGPVWEERFDNLPGFSNSLTREGFTYFITWDGILYKVNLREP